MLNCSSIDYQPSQIFHESKDHHPAYLNFHKQEMAKDKIYKTEKPSNCYRDNLKLVYTEELQNSLEDFRMKKLSQQEAKQNYQRSYMKDCYWEAQRQANCEYKRKEYYKALQQKQQHRAYQFVDDAQVHRQKVDSYVEARLDPNAFHHFQEKYDTIKQTAKRNLLASLKYQCYQHYKQKQYSRQEKENMQERRLKLQSRMEENCRLERQRQKEEMLSYQGELLQQMVYKKSKNIRNSECHPHARHNPITNPIDYHVDNPYIMKKIAGNVIDRDFR